MSKDAAFAEGEEASSNMARALLIRREVVSSKSKPDSLSDVTCALCPYVSGGGSLLESLPGDKIPAVLKDREAKKLLLSSGGLDMVFLELAWGLGGGCSLAAGVGGKIAGLLLLDVTAREAVGMPRGKTPLLPKRFQAASATVSKRFKRRTKKYHATPKPPITKGPTPCVGAAVAAAVTTPTTTAPIWITKTTLRL